MAPDAPRLTDEPGSAGSVLHDHEKVFQQPAEAVEILYAILVEKSKEVMEAETRQEAHPAYGMVPSPARAARCAQRLIRASRRGEAFFGTGREIAPT